jgi:DnaJ family protein C protein 8
MNLANEGLEARKKDEEVATKKRKAEDDKTWEGSFIEPRLQTKKKLTPVRWKRTKSWILANVFTGTDQEEKEN